MGLDEDYRALDLAPGATLEEVKEKYHELARKLHPDLNPGVSEEGKKQLKRANEAYARIIGALENKCMAAPAPDLKEAKPFQDIVAGYVQQTRRERPRPRKAEPEKLRIEPEPQTEKEHIPEEEPSTCFKKTKRARYPGLTPTAQLIREHYAYCERIITEDLSVFNLEAPLEDYFSEIFSKKLNKKESAQAKLLLERGITKKRFLESLIYTSCFLQSAEEVSVKEALQATEFLAKSQNLEQMLTSASCTFAVLENSAYYYLEEKNGVLPFLLQFQELYETFLPESCSSKKIPALIELIYAARKHFPKYLSTSPVTIEQMIGELVQKVLTGRDAELAARLLSSFQTCISESSRFPKTKLDWRKEYSAAKKLFQEIQPQGYSDRESVELLELIKDLKTYPGVGLRVRGLSKTIELAEDLVQIISPKQLKKAKILAEAVWVGGKGYLSKEYPGQKQEWLDCIKEALPVVTEHPELFRRAMVALEELKKFPDNYWKETSGSAASKEKEPNFTPFEVTVTATGYAGSRLAQKALENAQPEDYLEDWRKFLKGYRLSEYFPAREEPSDREVKADNLVGPQQQAYSLLRKIQSGRSEEGLPAGKVLPQDIQRLIEIYDLEKDKKEAATPPKKENTNHLKGLMI